ncbi:hypothetical protein [Maribacter sp.]|uniref:toxin-antitoxin system YwqK family antitoxin n=1 Tax=Maribacter sp. TaxID=1897614 RepID=UPI0032975D3F
MSKFKNNLKIGTILKLRISLFVCICFFLNVQTIFSQNDTIFYDAKWKVVSKEEASFFRPKVEKIGNLYKVEDYYINGNIQMRGTSSSNQKDVWEGVVSWYDENGKIYQQGTYANNRLNGEYISYEGDKRIVGQYKDGSFISGAMVSNYGEGHFYQEKKGDSLLQVYFAVDINGIRYENYSTAKKGNYLSKYYDDKGDLIGERKLLSSGYIKGLEVYYYYDPMRIQKVNYMPYGHVLTNAWYYANGQIREKVKSDEKWSKEYYDKRGKLLGEIEFQLNGEYLNPVDGDLISFHQSNVNDLSEAIRSVSTYSDGKIIEEQMFSTNGKETGIAKYENGFKVLQVNYDGNGKEVHRMEFKNSLPFNGAETTPYHTIVYKDGELVEEIVFYRDTQKPLKRITKTKEVYYDIEGNVLGELQVNFKNGYGTPWQGKRFTLGAESGEVLGMNEFKEGVLVRRTDFRKRLVGKETYETFKKIEEYGKSGYDKIREIHFYSNGQLQSDITYENYKEVKGVFYAENGKELGVYDYSNKDGKHYEFFRDTNEIRLFENYVDGVLITSKRFEMQTNVDYYEKMPILIHEFDINCCESFYSDKTGELLGSVEYVNQKPWKGIAYDGVDKAKYTIDKGERNGDYVKYDYSGKIAEEGQYVNDKKEGVFNYYNYYGALKKTENYNEGALHGDVIFYDEEGKLMSKVEYKGGKPYNGTVLLNMYSKGKINEETYVDGVLTKRISYGENGKNVSTYINGEENETIAYYEDSALMRLKYQTKSSYLDGEIIRYDMEGKEQYKAVLKRGKLISGTILLTTNDYNNKVSHIKVTKSEDLLSVEVIDLDGIIIFEGKEKLIMGSVPEYVKRLNIVSNYIDAYHLY